ncbi:MAG: hypothetical protein HY898_16675 [Deltaproteobacteria bacterium]|nr:hypothetical protein [Deltaproteobacteria bacterium]
MPASRFTFIEAASPLHDPKSLRSLLDGYGRALSSLGGVKAEPGASHASLPRVVLVATGGTEQVILDAVGEVGRLPLLLAAHPGHNSLPAAMEVLARVQQLGGRGAIHFLQGPRDEQGLRELSAAVGDVSVACALEHARIGLVGAPSDWLVASMPSQGDVRAAWGPEVVPIDLDSILRPSDEGEMQRAGALAADFRRGALGMQEPSEDDVASATSVHGLLKLQVQSQRLDAVAVRCFDLVTQRKTTGCLALAQLNDEGITAGCEGDVVSAVAMLWIQRMMGSRSWMANPSRIQLDRGVLSLAHCTVPRSMVGSYRLRSHFESGLGVGLQGQMPVGPVTLVRIGGARMRELRVVDGILLCNTDHPDLCRTQVEVEVGGDVLREMLARPLGNHVVVVAGHHAARLRRWHTTMIA